MPTAGDVVGREQELAGRWPATSRTSYAKLGVRSRTELTRRLDADEPA